MTVVQSAVYYQGLPCSFGLRNSDCKGPSIWFTSCSYLSNHSVRPRALWKGPLSSWKRSLLSGQTCFQDKGQNNFVFVFAITLPFNEKVDPNHDIKMPSTAKQSHWISSVQVSSLQACTSDEGWLIWLYRYFPLVCRPVLMAFAPLNLQRFVVMVSALIISLSV